MKVIICDNYGQPPMSSHTEAINAANQPQEEEKLFRSHHPSCSYLKSGSEQGPHDCGPEPEQPDTSVSILAALRFMGTKDEAEAAANLLRNAADYLCNTHDELPDDDLMTGDLDAVDLMDGLRAQLYPVAA